MNLLFDSSKLYIVKLGKVTKIIPAGWRTEGATYYSTSEEEFVAKLVKTSYNEKFFKLISKNIILSNNSEKTQNCGDLFICDAQPLNIVTNNTKHYLTKKTLIDFENRINENIKHSKHSNEDITK